MQLPEATAAAAASAAASATAASPGRAAVYPGQPTQEKPAVYQPPPARTERMQITLPAGAAAGTPVHVATSSGGEFEIVVPEGCGPGQVLEFDLPAPPLATQSV